MNDQNALEIERQRLQERYDEQPDSRVFAPLADCLRKLGRLQEALGVCHTGLSKHPRYSSAYVILGKIHLERGDDEAAREAFGRVLEFDPQNLLALRQLAELDEAREDFAGAVDRWELVAALEIDPAKAEDRLEAARARIAGPVAAAETPAPEPERESSTPSDDASQDEVIAAVEEASASADEGGESEADDAVEPEPEASAEDIDHSLIGATEDRSHEVLDPESTARAATAREESAAHEPPVNDVSPVPDDSALAPYRAREPWPSSPDDIDGIEDEAAGSEPEPEFEPEPEPAKAVEPEVRTHRPSIDDDAIPTTEIATLTLAEIYAEQGFRGKALDILRQVLGRNPDAEKVAQRIAELEATPIAPPAPAPAEAAAPPDPAPDAVEQPEPDPTAAEVENVLHPEPLALSADETEIESDDADEADDGPEVEPAPPLKARTSPEAEEEDERERYGHFRNWLDRIRVDD